MKHHPRESLTTGAAHKFHRLLLKCPFQFISDRHGDNGLLDKQPASPTPEKRFPPDVSIRAVTVRTFKGVRERVRFTGFLATGKEIVL
ncbi:MAG: hypothetical protein ABFD82_23560 [Syntrophaceae bacterium]